MAGKLYVLGEIDFDAVDRDLAALRQKRVGVEAVLEQLRGRLASQLDRGVTTDQMREVLKNHGISVSERRLREFIDAGAAKDDAGRTGVGHDGGADPEATAGGGGGERVGGPGPMANPK